MTAQRFYPDVVASFPYEPTIDRFAIQRASDLVGEGVVSLAHFDVGETVFAFTGFIGNEITQFSLQIQPGMHLHDPFFMGKVLHHCDPNTTVDMSRRVFTARRTIEPGDLVTMDYAETEDYLFKVFECQCNALNCRGLITGRLQTSYLRNVG